MSYLITFLVLACVLGPVFWIMPSPASKRKMRLRQHAMTIGLQVKICDLPQTHRLRVRQEPVEKGVMYRLPNKSRDKDIQCSYELCLKEETESQAGVHHPLLCDVLKVMPDDVRAIEISPLGSAIYWREKGDIEGVNLIFQELERLNNQLIKVSLG